MGSEEQEIRKSFNRRGTNWFLVVDAGWKENIGFLSWLGLTETLDHGISIRFDSSLGPNLIL